MKDYGIVKSTKQPEPREIDDQSVWINTEITPISEPGTDDEPGFEGWSYHQRQYDKDEYIERLDDQITDTQLAVVELYERG